MQKDYTKQIEELKPIRKNIYEYIDIIYQEYYKWDRIFRTIPGEELLIMQMKHVNHFVTTFMKLGEASALMDKILQDPQNDPNKTDFRHNLDEAERIMTEIIKAALEKMNFQETGSYLEEKVKKLLIDTNNRVIRHLQELKTIYNVFITAFNQEESGENPTVSGLDIFMNPIFVTQETEDFFRAKNNKS
jgi:hypothetical protein